MNDLPGHHEKHLVSVLLSASPATTYACLGVGSAFGEFVRDGKVCY